MRHGFRCPVCSGCSWRQLRRIDSTMRPVPPGLTRPERLRVVLCRCRGCSLEFNEQLLTGEDFSALYTEQELYSASDYVYEGDIRPKYTVDLPGLLARHEDPGRLLEVGFLDVGSLRQFADAGWDVTGLDLDGQAVAEARRNGFPAFQGDLAALASQGSEFDAVVAIAVFEHVEDPRSFLRHAAALLAAGGLLVLQLPNPGSLNAHVSRLSRDGWDMYGEPGHVFHYRRRHLLELVRSCGLKPVLYTTSTIRIRGKLPFVPGRAPRLERWVAATTHRHPLALKVYSAFLAFLGRLSLGDTHVLIIEKPDAR